MEFHVFLHIFLFIASVVLSLVISAVCFPSLQMLPAAPGVPSLGCTFQGFATLVEREEELSLMSSLNVHRKKEGGGIFILHKLQGSQLASR